jgi:dual specificity protein phosphatase 1B
MSHRGGKAPARREAPLSAMGTPTHDAEGSMHLVHEDVEGAGAALFVGALEAALSLPLLREFGITHVVNCTVAHQSQRDWTPHVAAGIQ